MKTKVALKQGIGIDAEHVGRFRGKKRNDAALRRIFSQYELRYCFGKANPEEHLAARFAAKEAVIKALSESGVKSITALDLRDIEIINRKEGVPMVAGKAIAMIPADIHVSLSHTETFAVAIAFVNS